MGHSRQRAPPALAVLKDAVTGGGGGVAGSHKARALLTE